MGRHSGVVLPSLFLFLFFLNAAEIFLLCSYSPTHIGCLASALKQRDGWGGVFHHKDVHFTTVRKAWIVFFCFVFFSLSFTHTAMAITACTESITANHCTLQRNKVSKGLILNDWEFVKMCWCGGLKRGPPLFCIAPPA